MSAAIAEHQGEIGRGTTAPASALTKAAVAVSLHLVGFVPVYFAAKINFESAASQGEAWAQFAVASTVLTAILVETAILLFLRRMFLPGIAALVLVLPFFAMNTLTASGNVGSADKHAKELRAAHTKTEDTLSDRRADAVKRRDAAMEAAAGETEQSALDKIERLKTEHPSSWNHSGGCDPAHITLQITKQDCGDIAALKAKAAAALAYEKARTDIEAIDAKSWNTGAIAVQSTGESAAANLVGFAEKLGYNLSPEDGEKVFEWGRGGGLELAAAIGPGVMNLFAWLLLGGASEAEARRIAEKARKAREAEEAEARRRETEARFAAEFEAKAAAEAEEKARAERAAKRAEAKTRETGDPETVKAWLNSSRTVLSPGHVLPLPVAYESYAADCRAHGETPVSRGKRFAEELRKLGIDVRERANRKRFEVYGLALSSPAARGGLRVAFSR